jgi:Holliday junction resolvase
MLTPEGRVKKQLRAVLDELGVYYFMPATGGYGRSGVPDIVGCARHQFFAIECKAKS